MEKELLITYLPQAASKETSPHKSFHKHLAGSQESAHSSHPAIRGLLTSKLRPGSRGWCQIPLPALFPCGLFLPNPGPFSSKGQGLPLCLGPLLSLLSRGGLLFPWKPVQTLITQLLDFQRVHLVDLGLSSTETSEGHSTEPVINRLSNPHPCSVPTTPQLRLLVPSRRGLLSGETALGSSKSRWKIPPIQQAPSRERVEQLAGLADIQPLANIQPGSGNDRIVQKLTRLLGGSQLVGGIAFIRMSEQWSELAPQDSSGA